MSLFRGTKLQLLIGLFAFLFLFSIFCAGRKAFAVFAIMLFPCLDVVTDIIYLVLTLYSSHVIHPSVTLINL